MLSKAKIKLIRQLEIKKYRDEYKLFVAEGNKTVADMIPFFDCELLIAEDSWISRQNNLKMKELIVVGGDELRKVSLLKTPQDVLAVFRYPDYKTVEINTSKELVLALDGIQDPGNLGTMIRLADWFGIGQIVCSRDTADAFGPKAVQASMGALRRVKVHYIHLEEFLKNCETTVYGAFLDGTNLYDEPLSSCGVIVVGNEGNGIRPNIESLINRRLYIPHYQHDKPNPDSLNAALAAAIICAEFRRKEPVQKE
ncbi:MAG: RNA methyltransferase [Tannerella sp.]|jgi:TrmH family RNA methyltransferase|nr:RNA methyltransferase [Tannerella sp.]